MKLLNTKKPLCFLHIPKTAGTTLEEFNKSHFAKNKIYPRGKFGFLAEKKEDQDRIKRYLANNISNYKYIASHDPYSFYNFLSQDEKPNFVTLLRNPAERIISFYNYANSYSPKTAEPIIDSYPLFKLAREKSILDFISNDSLYESNNYQTKFLASSDKLSNKNELFESAKENIKNNITLIGVSELFDVFLSHLCLIMKWDYKSLKKKNTIDSLYATPEHKKYSNVQLNHTIYSEILKYNEIDFKLYKYVLDKINKDFIKLSAQRHKNTIKDSGLDLLTNNIKEDIFLIKQDITKIKEKTSPIQRLTKNIKRECWKIKSKLNNRSQ